MGVEDYRLRIESCDVPAGGAIRILMSYGLTAVPKQQSGGPPTHYFECRDGGHVLEFALTLREDGWPTTTLSCRFALCHPSTVDVAFMKQVMKLGEGLRGQLGLASAPPPGFLRVNAANRDAIEPEVFRQIAFARAQWRRDFGAVEAALTCAEALSQFLLHRPPGGSKAFRIEGL